MEFKIDSNAKVNLSKVSKKKLAYTVLSAAAFLFLTGTALESSPSVGPGETGFIWDNATGGFTGQELHQGRNWLSMDPFTSHIVTYPTANMQYTMSRVADEGKQGDTSVQFTSKDHQVGNVDVTVQWAVNPKMAAQVYNMYGSDINVIEEKIIRMHTKTAVNDAASQFDILDIHGASKAQFNQTVADNLQKEFDKDLKNMFILVAPPQIGQDYLPPSMQQFVNAKIQADTNQQIAQTKLAQVKVEAQQKVVNANADAQAAKAKADADLYVAQKQAEGNKALGASMSKDLIDYTFAKNISSVPQVWSNGSLLNMLPSRMDDTTKK